MATTSGRPRVWALSLIGTVLNGAVPALFNCITSSVGANPETEGTAMTASTIDHAADEDGGLDEQGATGSAEEVPQEPDNGAAPGPQFATVEEFVTHFVVPFYIRDTANAVWCRQWWAHREAGARLEALWEAYEGARASTEGSAYSSWWRLEADHHLPLLLSREGPFRNCNARADTHTLQTPQPLTPPPKGMFMPDTPTAADAAP